MPVSNEEKYLKSIDGSLKDILKELKKANRTHLVIDSNLISESDLEELKEACKKPQDINVL